MALTTSVATVSASALNAGYTANGYRDVVFGNGQFVSVGWGTSVATSPDGITWTSRTCPNGNWSSVTYGNGLYVAVGSSGVYSVMTSTDGIDWYLSAAFNRGWVSVAYGNGLFVAVNADSVNQAVMYSTDGYTWNAVSVSHATSWQSVAYGNERFVAVGQPGTAGKLVMTSTDGINWSFPTYTADNYWSSVTYGNGLFVAVSFNGTNNRIMSSPDGVTWTNRGTSALNYLNSKIVYDNGLFVVLTDSQRTALVSTNGISWSVYSYSSVGTQAMTIAYGNGLWVSWGIVDNNTGNYLMTSTNATTWTGRKSAASNVWNAIAYGNGVWVAIAYSGASTTNMVMYSTDETNWTLAGIPTANQWVSVTYGAGLFVAVAQNGTNTTQIATSTDGITWTHRTSPAPNFTRFTSIVYGGNKFVVVSGDSTGRVLNSSDGITWTLHSAPLLDYRSVNYGEISGVGTFVAVTNSNNVIRSTDGINWTSGTGSVVGKNWDKVTFGDGKFLAASNQGGTNSMMYSTDAINWTTLTVPNTAWNAVTYGECQGQKLFIGISDNNIYQSTNLTTWTASSLDGVPSQATKIFGRIAYGNGRFVILRATVNGSAVPVKLGKRTPTISLPASFSKIYGDSGFSLNATSTNTQGELSYSSSNTTVATVNSSGSVTPLSVGSSTILVSQNETTDFIATSSTTTITVAKQTSTITTSNSLSVTYGDSAVTLSATTNNTEAAITFTSSNLNVATVNSSGLVTFLKAGSCTITVSVAETANFTSGTATVSVTVAKKTSAVTAPGSFSKTYGDNAFSLGATDTNEESAITYSSSNTAVATVNSLGTVTIIGAGSCTITSSVSETDDFTAASATTTITVAKKTTTLSVASSFSKFVGDNAFSLNVVTNNSEVATTYASSNSGVATVDSNGQVTVVAVGSCTITVSKAASANFTDASTTTTISVSRRTTVISVAGSFRKGFADIGTSFSLNATSNSPATITYVSSNTSVATVDSNGQVTIVGEVGTSCTITLTQEQTAAYTSGSATTTILVAEAGTNTVFTGVTASYSKTYGDSAFSLGVSTNNTDSAIEYSSSNTDVATVGSNGLVTIIGYGSATITIYQPDSANFNSGSATSTVNVAKATTAIVADSTMSKVYGDNSFSISATSNNNEVPITFSSSNTAVATVDSVGTVIIIGAGTATITLSQVESSNYTSGTHELVLTVAKKTPTLTVAASFAKTFGDSAFNLNAASDSPVTITYSSADTSVATVNSSGLVTIVGAGSVVITVAQVSNDNYESASATSTVTVAAAFPTIGTFTFTSPVNFGASPFTLVQPSSNSEGAFSYSSTNTAVATVSGSTVTIVGAGSANIVATQAASGNYAEKSVSSQLVVNTVSPTLTNFYASGISKTFGNAAFSLIAPTSNSSGTFSYTSSNTSIATISGSTVTIVGAGTVTITATQAASGNYSTGSINTTLTVAKADPTFSTWTVGTVVFGSGLYTIPQPTSNSDGAFTYSSGNTGIATITTNKATLVSVGNATITATQAATTNYNSGTVTSTLTVSPAAPTIGAMTFTTPREIGSGSFTITAPSSNSGGSFTYTSSNTSVATISGSTVSLVGVGSTTITATQAAAGNYTSGTVTRTLVITLATPNIGTLTAITGISPVTYGASNITLTAPTSNSSGSFTYTSSNTSVATISGTTLSIVGAGSSTITATQAAAGDYASGSVTATLTVAKKTAVITLSVPSLTWQYPGAGPSYNYATYTAQPSNNGNTGAYTYSFSVADQSYATVNDTSGLITLLAAKPDGITLNVSQAGDNNHNSNTTTVTVYIAKANPNLRNFGPFSASFMDPNVFLSPPESDDLTGSITYSVVSESVSGVASIDINGTDVVIGNAGTATIRATQSETSNFTGAYIDATLTVSQIDPSSSIMFSITSPVTYGDPAITLTAMSSSTGLFTYESSDTTVATISGDQLTIVGASSNTGITITVYQAADNNYTSGSQTATLIVEKATPVLSDFTLVGQTYQPSPLATYQLPVPTTPSTGAFSYSSSNTTVATVDSVTGLVTIQGAGQTTITATQASDSNYNEASIFDTLFVDKAVPNLGTFSDFSATYLDTDVTIDPPTTDSNGGFTYSVITESVSGVATISGNTVVVGVVGTSTIRASQAETDNFYSAYVDATFTVNPKTTTAGNLTVPSNKVYGDAPFDLTYPTTDSDGSWTLTSSDPTIASISGVTVTILKAGTVTITAEISGGNYTTTDRTATLTIAKQTTNISVTGSFRKTTGEEGPFSLGATSNNNETPIVYTSSDTSIAVVDSNGDVTIVGAIDTEFTITVSQVETDSFTSASETVTIIYSDPAVATNITVDSSFSVTYGDSAFSLNATTNNNETPIVYTSSNTSVVIVDSSGLITIVGAGSATITLFQADTVNYNNATVTTSIVVAKQQAVIVDSSSQPFAATLSANYNDATFNLGAQSNSSASLTYTSSNTSVAIVDGLGGVSVLNAGTTTITISQAESANYTAAVTVTLDLTVAKIAPTVGTLNITSPRVWSSGLTIALTDPTSNSSGSWSYASSDVTKVSVTGNTLEVNNITAGTPVTITATQAESNNYLEATVTATLEITPATPVIGTLALSSQTYTSVPITITDPTSDSMGSWSYSVDNTSVATVSGNVLTLVGLGDVTVTATQAADGNYGSASTSTTITISAADPNLSMENIVKSWGDSDFTPVTTSSSSGAITFSVVSNGVASIVDNAVHILAAGGPITITATQAADGNYTSATTTAILTVNPVNPTLSNFNALSYAYTPNTFTIDPSLYPTSNSSGEWSFSIVDSGIATVSLIDGKTIQLVGVGLTTIIATQAAAGNYTSGVITANFTVTKGTPVLSNFADRSVAFSASPYTLTAPTSLSDGSFSYTSSNLSVATISGAVMTFVSRGFTDVTATQASTSLWNSATITARITIPLEVAQIRQFNPNTLGVIATDANNAGYANKNFTGFAYGNGIWVAVNNGVSSDDESGAMYSTDNGLTWTLARTPTSYAWQDVTYGEGLFVAVGVSGTIMTSSDGINWEQRGRNISGALNSVSYGGGRFVAVTSSSTVHVSNDGTTWVSKTFSGSLTEPKITYGNGTFVILSSSGTNRVYVSTDLGETWTGYATPVQNTWTNITFGNGQFVAVSYNGTVSTRIITSPDGITWTTRSAADSSTWNSLAYGNGLFVAIADSGSSRIMTSSDGITWTLATAPVANSWARIGFANGRFIAASFTNSASDRLMTSTNGTTWSIIPSCAANAWSKVAYGNGKWVAFSTSGPSGKRAAYSTDGANWTITSSGMDFPSLDDLCFGNGIFLLVSDTGNVKTSSDGINWTTTSVTGNPSFKGVVFGNGKFVAVNNNKSNQRVATSTDGTTWTLVTTPSTANNTWRSIAYQLVNGNHTYVAVSTDGTNRVMTSTDDAATWTVSAPTGASVRTWVSVTYGNGLFAAVSNSGSGNRVMTSPDGLSWTQRTTATDYSWTTIKYGNGLFVIPARDSNGLVMTSSDGITWTNRATPYAATYQGLEFGDNKFVLFPDFGISATPMFARTFPQIVTNDLLSGTFTIPTKTFTDAAFNLNNFVSPSSGAWTFTSSNTAVATVSGSTATLVAGGTTTITATQAATSVYASTVLTSTLTVNKKSIWYTSTASKGISYPFYLDPLVLSQTNFTPSYPTFPSTGAKTLTSSDPSVISVATVGGIDKLTAVSIGSASITLNVAEDSKYNAYSATVEGVVTKATPNLGTFTVASRLASVGSFTLTPPTSGAPPGLSIPASTGAWSYTSSDTSVLTISGNVATIVAVGGPVTITATQAETDTYFSGSKTATGFYAQTGPPTIGEFTISPSTVAYGSGSITLTAPTSNSSGTWTFSSSNTNVAQISGSTVTLAGAGTATITATQAASTIYESTTATATLTVTKGTPVISTWTIANRTYSAGGSFTLSPPTTTPASTSGTWSYALTNPADTSVISLSGTNGATANYQGAGGPVSITATLSEAANWFGGSTTATVTVSKANPTIINTNTTPGFAATVTKNFALGSYEISSVGMSNSPGAFTFTVPDNNGVATISGTTVTFVAIGTVTITATQVETANYFSGTKTSVLTVAPVVLTLGTLDVQSPKTYLDAPYTITNPTSNSPNGTWSYTSSNTSVATISGNQITVVAPGTSTITGTQAASGNYASGSTTATLTVNKANTVLSFADINKTYGDAAFNLTNVLYAATSTNGSTGAITYSIVSGGSYATISGSTITIVGAGTVTLRASQAATTNYNAGTKDCTLTIAKASPNLRSFNAVSKTYLNAPFTITAPASDSAGAITYTSDNTSVISISGTTATVAGAGTAVITASQATTANYLAGTITATYTVSKANPTLTFSNFAKNYGISPFDLSQDAAKATSNNSVGAITYTSSDSTVASVDADGVTITIHKIGTTTLTANQAETDNFNATNVTTQKTATLTVNAIAPTLSDLSISNITYTYPYLTFTLTAPTSNSAGAFTYSSLNTLVSTVSGTTVTVIGAGLGSIRATQAANGNYTSGYIDASFTVSKATPVITFNAITKNYLDSSFNLTNASYAATSLSTGAFTYSIDSGSPVDVVTLSGTTVTVVNAGTVTLNVTQAADTNYLAGSASTTLTVNPIAPTITFANFAKNYGISPFNLSTDSAKATSTSSGAITYSSSDTTVATVGGDNVTITILKAGTTTITASQASTRNYTSGTSSKTMTVNTIAPTLSNFSVPTKTYLDSPFELTAPTSNSAGAFSYSSSNTSVATISGSQLTIVGAGTSTITATQAADGNYTSGTITASFTVNKANTTISFADINKTYGDSPFTVSASSTNGSTGAFTYSIVSGGSYATISGSTVTIVSAGTVTLRASQAATTNYNAGTQDCTLTIAKANPNLRSFAAVSKTYLDTSFTISAPTSDSVGAITYTSDNTSVISISGTTATVAGAGTAVITASQATTTNYLAGTITATYTVAKADPTLSFSAFSKNYGIAPFDLSQDAAKATSNNSAGAITYTSSDTTVASVGGDGVTITIHKIGTTTLTASQAETDNFNATDATTEKTAVMTVNAIAPTLSNFTISNVTYTDPQTTFTLSPPTTNSAGAFTYTSLSTSYATVSGTTVTVVGAGTATIRATQAANGNYTSGYIEATFTISKGTPTITFNNITKTYLDSSFNLALTPYKATSTSTGAFTYSIDSGSPVDVVSLSGTTVTVLNAGSVTINAAQAADANFNARTVSATLTVNPKAPSLSFANFTKNFGVSSFNINSDSGLKPTSTSSGSFTYASSNTTVASVDNDGVTITVNNIGDTTLTATQASTRNYTSGSVTAIMTVEPIAPTWSFTIDNKTYDNPHPQFTFTAPSSNSGGDFTFESLTTQYVTLATTDNITYTATIVGAGAAQIRATQVAYGNYTDKTVIASFTIAKGTPVLSNFSIPTKTYGDDPFTLSPPQSSSDGTLTYSYTSSNASVATISGSTMTIVGAGNSAIKAIQAETDNWLSAEITAVFTTNQASPNLRNFSIPASNYLGPDVTITAPGSDSDGAITYSIPVPNTAVATLSGSTLTVVGAGSVVVRATQASTTNYISQYIETTFVVNPIDPTLTFVDFSKNYGIAAFDLSQDAAAATSTSPGLITYESSDPTVASVDNDGVTITIHKIGTTTITANQAASTNYNATNNSTKKSVTLTVNPIAPTYASGFIISTQTYAADFPTFAIVAPSSNSGGSFTYESLTTQYVTVSGTTATIVGAGSAQIRATQAAYGNYTEGVVTASFTIQKANPVFQTWSVPTKNYGDSSFTLVAPVSTNTETSSYTYTVIANPSYTNVATISGSTVQVNNSGLATIRATQASTDNYNSGYTEAEFTVNRIYPSLSNFVNMTKNYGSTSFALARPTSTNSETTTFTYTSSDVNVATISGTSAVVGNIGTTTITATQIQTRNYYEQSITATLTVLPIAPTFTYTIATKTYLDSFVLAAPTDSNSAGTFSFASQTPSTVTVTYDGSTYTANIIAVGSGTGTIRVTQAANGNYTSTYVDVSFTIVKKTPVVSFNDITVDYLSGTVDLTNVSYAPTSDSDGLYSYAITGTDADSIATVSGSTVTVGQVGSVTLTATQASTSNWNSATSAITFTVNPIDPQLTFNAFSKEFIVGSFNLNSDSNAATSTSDGAITYSSSNSTVATVDSDGVTIIIHNVGTTTLTASQASTRNYNATNVSTVATATFTVTPSTPTNISFSLPRVSYLGNSFSLTPYYSSDSAGLVTFVSSDETIAKVVNDGSGNATVLQIVEGGSCTISATQVANGNYSVGTATATLYVDPIDAINVVFVDLQYTFEDPPFTLAYSSSATTTNTVTPATVTYSSSDTSVIAISGSTATIVGGGTAIITATQNATNNYNQNVVTATVTVLRTTPEVGDFSVPLRTYGEPPFQLTPPTSESDGAWSFLSSNPAVATISGDILTITGRGVSTITAIQAETASYFSTTRYAVFNSQIVTVFSTTFEVPEKTYTDGSFQLTPPGTNSNADFEYTSDDTSVATIIGDTVIIQGAGQCTITVRQVPTPYYTEQTATATLVVTKSLPTFSLSTLGISQGHITIGSHSETTFTMATKTYGNANIPLGTILSNSPGTKAFSSSNSAVASISGSNIVIAGAGSATISVSQPETANFLARTITGTLVVQKRQHALTNFSFVTKTYGDLPFTIVAPTQSNTGAVLSTGAITYSSNVPSVASINGNVITINGPGIATITATQAADVNYLSATVSATFEVLQSSPGNPVQVESVEEVLYVLTTDTPYVQLSNDIILPAVEPGQTYEPLINTGEVPKTFESSDYIIIRRDS